MGTKYYDSAAVMQVIGCSMLNPSLLEDNGEYFYNESDFVNDFHKVVFGSIFNLYQMGAKKVNILDLENYLSNRTESLSIYNAHRGPQWLQEIVASADLANFDYYYQRMKKMTLLRGYEKEGVDVRFLYNPDELFDLEKKKRQEDYLDSLSLNEISDIIDNKILDVRSTYVDNATDEIKLIGSTVDDILEQIKQTPLVGFPLYGKFINAIHRGARRGTYHIRSAPTNVGKAIPNNTYIPTPNGYRYVKDIKEGDYLFGSDGLPTRVLKIHPQEEKKRVYVLLLEDGRMAECCKEHLWGCEYFEDGKWISVTKSTKEILLNVDEKEYYIPLTKAAQYKEKKMSQDPYLLGVTLGYNCFHEDAGIPYDLLQSSVYQKICFLKGFSSKRNNFNENKDIVWFGDVNENLRKDLLEICYSLGLYISSQSCSFHYSDLENLLKKDRDKQRVKINSVFISNRFSDMTCFTVEAKDSLFLMNNFIVTHNTRYMIADMCYMACSELYNTNTRQWETHGKNHNTLYISTEQTVQEITTMCLAFLSGVSENKIVLNQYETEDEYQRVLYAANVLKNSPLYIEEMPDFTMKDVENCIKRSIRTHKVKYVFFDYIQSSVSILGEISRMSGGTKLREDNVLFLLSAKLKDIATKFDVFIETSTQVNGDFKTEKIPDQNLLRGSKAIADRADFGAILLNATIEDLDALEDDIKRYGLPVPNVKLSVYKNRGGSWNRIFLWMVADRGTCRFDTAFITDFDYKLITDVPEYIITSDEEED